MGSTFSHLESITDTLAAADIYGSIKNLKSSLEKMSAMMENLNSGKGSAGQFLTNDSIYVNLNNSLASLNELLVDIKANPKKYIHISVFRK
jgi:phospholipid/cholesterol/gamma-HCH transport system substrate-binding protein